MSSTSSKRLGRAAVLLALLSLSPAARAEVVNQVVATVDGDPITAFELESFIRQTTGADPASLDASDRRKALDVLITDALIRGESQRLGLSASEAEIDAYIGQIKQQNNLDDAALDLALKQQGLTIEGYRAQIKKEILKNQLVSRQIRQRVNISPEEVQRYYEEHQSEFAQPAAVKVRHVFFALPATAGPDDAERTLGKVAEAKKRLASGEDFEDVARDLSEGPEASEGGLLGTMRKGQMLPEIEEVAFSLQEGEVSDPVRSPAGVHILKVDEREDESKVAMDEVKEQIKERLYAQAIESRFQQWMEKDLKAGHSIVIRQ
jgi:peptidyl-prolyl cis-trans isomerase SurA